MIAVMGTAKARASDRKTRPVRGALWIWFLTGWLLLAGGCATLSGHVESPPSPIAMTPQPTTPAPLLHDTAVPSINPLPPRAPSGSLWSANGGSLYQDIKARNVGDILTIVVSEESRASKSAQTGTQRSKNFSGSASFGGLTAGDQTLMGPATLGAYQGEFGMGFKGQGTTAKNDSMSAYMTATVVDILPNGNLFIRGSRWTKVNNEMQQIILEGVVRPNDVTRNNTILSQNIADAKIFFEGKGPLTQHQRPGWLLQLLDLVSPF